MIKKIFVIIFIACLIFLMLTPSVIGVDTMELVDNEGDVEKKDESGELILEATDFPDFDIKKLNVVQDGQEIEVTLELVEDGEFRKTEDEEYVINLITTNASYGGYNIVYLGIDISYLIDLIGDDLTPEELEELEIFNLELVIWDFLQSGEFIEPKSYTIKNNVLTVTFELENKNEKVLTAFANIQAYSGEYVYFDYLPDNITSTDDIFTLDPIVEETFKGEVNENIAFHANLSEGNSSDYNWLWVVEDNEILISGQNPSKSFSHPGNYSGILYVYNDEQVGYVDFYFDVEGSISTSSGNDDEDSGSGLMMFAILIAIIVIIGIFVVILVIRR